MTHTFLQTARNRAVAERRNFVLTFLSDTSMQVERIEVPSGTLTVVDMLASKASKSSSRMGLPDTPDHFGGATTAINFTGVRPVMFTSDGSLIDAAGDVTNGTVFIAKPSNHGDRARDHGCGRHRPDAHMEMERVAMAAANRRRTASRPLGTSAASR